jgi:hypothetical protein
MARKMVLYAVVAVVVVALATTDGGVRCRHSRRTRFHCAAVLGILVTGIAYTAQFHIDPGGRDTNAGTMEAPFVTLTAARDAVRAMKRSNGLPEGGVTIQSPGKQSPQHVLRLLSVN